MKASTTISVATFSKVSSKASTLTAIALALSLVGCSFKEDRNDIVVPIIDAAPAKSFDKAPSQQESTVPKTTPTYIYTVRSGDTLGTIARKYLGSSSRYTELLALNDLDTNDAIYVGQQLKLPTKGLKLPEPSSATKADQAMLTTENQANSNQNSYPELDALLKSEEYNQAIQWLLSNESLASDQQLQQKLVSAALAQSDRYERQQDVADAETLLSGLITNAPISSQHQNTLETKLSTLRAEQQLLTAKRHADKSEFDASYGILLNAWQQVGKPLEDNILFTSTRNKVSEDYHQKALRLYRNQKLNDALKYWKKILAINPNDDLALVYQDRVKALQNKLENL